MYDDGSISGGQLAAREADWAQQLKRRRAAVARWRGIAPSASIGVEEMLGASWGHQRRGLGARGLAAESIILLERRVLGGGD